MLSVLSVDGVEKRIGEVPGVESVTVNFAAGSATVRYDETRLEIADIKSAVRQSGYEPPRLPPLRRATGHEGHAAAGRRRQRRPPAAPNVAAAPPHPRQPLLPAPQATTTKPAPDKQAVRRYSTYAGEAS